MAFQMSIIAIGSLMLQFALNGLGAASVAAYTASQKIEVLLPCPLVRSEQPWQLTLLKIMVREKFPVFERVYFSVF